MKKIFFIILALFCISIAAYLAYLNEVVLPEKIKTAVVENLSCATGKNVSLSGAKLDIFRGLVLKDLIIFDEKLKIVASKDVSASFLITPLFKKQIIITVLRLNSPEIFLERMPDSSINIVEIFFKKPLDLIKCQYSLSMSHVIVSAGTVTFRDDTLEPIFTKEINNVAFDGRALFPTRFVFNAEFNIPSQLPMFVKASGEYKAREKELSLDLKTRDLYIKEFSPYFKDTKIELPEGRLDGYAKLYFKDNILDAQIDMTSLGLNFSRDKINASLNCNIKARAKYNFNNKEFLCAGDLDMKNLALSGLGYVDKIDNIRGKVVFSGSKFSSDNITCTVLGVPVAAKAGIAGDTEPVMKIDVNSEVALDTLEDILKNRFKMNIPVEMSGRGSLNLMLQYKMPAVELTAINGSLGVKDAMLKLEYGKTLLEDVNGKIGFTHNQLIWSDLLFKYKGEDYKTSGVLTNFDSPGIDLKLSSNKLDLQSLLAVNGKVMTLSKLDGRFDNSDFSIQGDIDMKDSPDLKADITGKIRFDLNEAIGPLKKINEMFKNSKPSGRMTANFTMKGNLNDIVRSSMDVTLSSERVYVFGLKISDFEMMYMQRNGIMDIVRMHSSLYGGTLDATGNIDLVSKDMPYQISADMKGVRIENIKRDTVLKDKDISGSLQAHFGAKGFSSDNTKLSAWGKVNILNGKLWQLNLFHGIGTLLFKRDFGSVVFKEGSCDFVVKERSTFLNDLVMKSDLLNISGVVKLSFDNSISAYLKAEFTDEGIDAGNMSDMAGAIERYSIIEIKGTLKEPKCRIRPDLTNVISDFADNLLQQ